MFIDQLRAVVDLNDGDRALPEPGTVYELRTMANETIDAGAVTEVRRVGDVLYAITASGERYPVTGNGSPVLVPIQS